MSGYLRRELQQPQTRHVILAQSVDTSVAIALALFHAALLAPFVLPLSDEIASPLALALGIGLTVWALNMAQRLFFVSFLGATLGQHLVGTRACLPPNSARFWAGQAIEALHPVLPFLWALEIAGRLNASPYRGLRYMVLGAGPTHEL